MEPNAIPYITWGLAFGLAACGVFDVLVRIKQWYVAVAPLLLVVMIYAFMFNFLSLVQKYPLPLEGQFLHWQGITSHMEYVVFGYGVVVLPWLVWRLAHIRSWK